MICLKDFQRSFLRKQTLVLARERDENRRDWIKSLSCLRLCLYFDCVYILNMCIELCTHIEHVHCFIRDTNVFVCTNTETNIQIDLLTKRIIW